MHIHRMIRRRLSALGPVAAIACVALLVRPDAGQAQAFGKNKVQYQTFNYQFIQSEHFDLYYTDGGYELAQFAADAAEDALKSVDALFKYKITKRIPFVVYNSHNDFQQNNVVDEYLEEGVGGVTELYKNRITIPFEGNYRMFRHVIHHELVHAVINDMFYGGSLQNIVSQNIRLSLPLWWNEGLAEYASLRWDTNSDMFMRDATMNTYLPPIDYLNGYFAYRGGQSIWYYIANKYGEQKIAEIMHKIRSTRSVDAGFKTAIGLTVEELNERWQREQKVRYWPEISLREEAGDFAKALTDHEKQGNNYNTSPTISPQGDKVAFITDRNQYFDVYVMDATDGKHARRVVKGQRSNDLEELHLLTPGLSWSPDGQQLALAAKAGANDAVLIINAKSGRRKKLTFSELDGIFSVRYAPTGNRIAFIGSKGGASDVFVYDLDSKQLTNLTDDPFSEADPAWSPDGATVYFTSDRGATLSGAGLPARFSMHDHDYTQMDLYRMPVAGGAVERLTATELWDEESPVISPDGTQLLYVSDRNGIFNMYRRDLATGREVPVTNVLSGVRQLSLSRDGNKLTFVTLNKAGFDIFLMKAPFDRDIKLDSLPLTRYAKRLTEGDARPDVAVGVDSSTALGAVATLGTVQIVGGRISGSGVVPTGGDSTRTGGVGFVTDTTGVRPAEADYSSYVFTPAYDRYATQASATPEQTAAMFRPSDNRTDSGNYKPKRYKLNFSPDIIYGNAGFDALYGVQGATQMAFSDLLGNHKILFQSNLLLDLKNSDYALAYQYLPHRTDYGFYGYHTARFFQTGAYLDENGRYVDGAFYRYRTYGGGVTVSYPFNRFNRVDADLSTFRLVREAIVAGTTEGVTVAVPGISFTHDTSLFGYTAPFVGSRYTFGLSGSPKLGSEGLQFLSFNGDARTYFPFWRSYSLAFRLAGASSIGSDPQKYYLGGTPSWLNFKYREFPIGDLKDFVFASSATPLRGVDYNEQNGSHYALFNTELRFPLIRYFVPGPLPVLFSNIVGVGFVDMGAAWGETVGAPSKKLRLTDRKNYDPATENPLLIGTGVGARVPLFYFLLKIDVAWQNLPSGNWTRPRYYFSLGADF